MIRVRSGSITQPKERLCYLSSHAFRRLSRVKLRKRRESSRDWLSTENYWGGEHDYGGVNLGILHGADNLHGTRVPVLRRITPLEHFTGALSSVEQRIMCGLDCMVVRWHVLQPLASGLFRSNPCYL